MQVAESQLEDMILYRKARKAEESHSREMMMLSGSSKAASGQLMVQVGSRKLD